MTAGNTRRGAIIGIALDVLPPTVAYFALRAFGVRTELALVGATAVAGLRLAYVAVRTRRFDVFAAFLMAVYGLSFLTALVSGDDRFLLLRESVTTGVLAAGFLLSCVVGKPLVFLAARRASGDAEAPGWDHRWATEPGVRRTFTVLTFTWGWGLLAEATVRIPLVYLLPPDVMVGVSSALQVVAVAALVAWSVRYVKRRKRNGAPVG
ncbi:VC0807 family protein [Amycolatopsis minnesotensis]|uniref:Intracellular septation protein A n=1 Tax=Amycolatopsis minnesotensis TaxID=337894 RepID=A0ABN2R6N2_9PSEU